MTSDSRTAYRARWVFTGRSEPIAAGVVEVESGSVAAVHDRGGPRAIDLGNVAIVPGLINSHTHLEFSDLREPLGPPAPFTGWIREVIRHRAGRTEQTGGFVARGLAESAAAGTTLVGEIATADAEDAGHGPEEPAVCVFRELIGLTPDRIQAQCAVARRHLEARAPGPPTRGLSPHAPYSVHPELFEALAALAAERRVPVMTHLAETRAELELLSRGRGEFVEMLREFGLWRDGLLPRGLRPMDYLRRLAPLGHALVAHGNYLAPDELAFVADRPQFTVVYCPRTHAYFGHGEHPWRELLRRRETAVAVGTDSRASNPDLSIWGELQFLRRRFPDVHPRLLLRLATVNGATALGWGDAAGTLEAGRPADLAVVSLSDASDGDGWSALFSEGGGVVGTMRSGRWIGGHPAPRSSGRVTVN